MYTSTMATKQFLPRKKHLTLFTLFCSLVAAQQTWSEGSRGTDLVAAQTALANSKIPTYIQQTITAKIKSMPDPFLRALELVSRERERDPMMFYRVDKNQALPTGYRPQDLASLTGTDLSIGRKGLMLRNATLRALEEMSAAARAEGVTLLVSSTYRSYEYQTEVFGRNVREMGRAEAEMVSAMPGHSQHQLGTAIDFGSITDAFAETKASRWLANNARRFGFSLSFPKGLTEVTGYKWESWHYRYIGKAAATLEENYFEGVQQYLMLFLDALR